MSKKTTACISALVCVVIATSSYSADLMQVYRQALDSDPTFKKAQADWLSAKENLPIAMSGTGAAGSGLFPYLDLSGSVNRTYQKQSISSGPSSSGYFNGNQYLLTLTQPIFNYQTWKSISSARYSVKGATAAYLASAQDLMFRVAQAYFNVLSANDQLGFTIAQKNAFLRQLITAEQKFKVGLIAVTGVYDAQASYDDAVATEIKDENNLANQLENLRAITGVQYDTLKGLRSSIPLVIPKPSNIEQWVRIADQQNYTIKSDLYTMLSARETIKQNAAARYPTVVGQATYGTVTTGTIPGLGVAVPAGGGVSDTITTNGTVGLALDFPVFQGGHVTATTKQAEYKFLSASDQLDFQHRNVDNQTRQAFLGVQSGISQIQADIQAIKSARNKLEATQAGYVVGTRTMVDVLNAVTALTQAQQTWANDRYNYVISIITLAQQAGTLSPEDLAKINAWLSKTELFNPEKKVSVSRYAKAPLPKPTELAMPPIGGQPTRIFHHPVTPPSRVSTTTTVKPALQHTATVDTRANREPMLASQKYYYAVQVYANPSLEKAHEFLQQHPVTPGMHVVYDHQMRWYKVIYGHYVNRAEAMKALQQIPNRLKQYKPWVVKVPIVSPNSSNILKRFVPAPGIVLPRPNGSAAGVGSPQAAVTAS